MTTTTGTFHRSLTYVLPRPLAPAAARNLRRRLTAAEPLGEFYRRLATTRRP